MSKIEDYAMLYEDDDWAYMREDDHVYGQYSFIVHKTCSGGGESNMMAGGCIMHYQKKRCQYCNMSPSDSVMTAYILHQWDTPNRYR